MRVVYRNAGLNYLFFLAILLGIVILLVPNILEFVIAFMLIVFGISGLIFRSKRGGFF
ncbi:MAG: DUF3096 domain-containing protein [Nanoarchaeota archaeon]|nr:DUF3096 domain-containing protein [Nanoarchaeota archaeon]MBU1030809.1 DUF3096 domain-containing protein [Nanoarchaeota archaeon]MBU1850180.1 DUF3096 domain-containing protein [Nanoarchaeota archaeon]